MQPTLFETEPQAKYLGSPSDLLNDLAGFRFHGRTTAVKDLAIEDAPVTPSFTNEFWTAKQRAAHSLHEISYRACFKPQLPRFFIERLTQPGELVYDPFMGRGTTILEAALLGRHVAGNDINPLSKILSRPRLHPPDVARLEKRMAEIDLADHDEFPEELLVFYHPETLREICALKKYFARRVRTETIDHVDRWIRMVAVNRLSGHSPGFFSVYTLPPNQAVTAKKQAEINAQRNQSPPRRDVRTIILKKSRTLMSDCDVGTMKALSTARKKAKFLTSLAEQTPGLRSNSVALVVTSPPFLSIVDYARDNWLRCWFCGIEADAVPITSSSAVSAWSGVMLASLKELKRVLKPGGYIAFEVGEVRKASLNLDEVMIPVGVLAGLEPVLVLVNKQKFTKTANCWGVGNNEGGTNSNRVVLFRKPAPECH
ncbi:MAG: DNA methyltransferase [Candidatus Hydrogenedentota bacterium]